MSQTNTNDEISLRDIVNILRRRKWVVIIAVIVCLIIALGFVIKSKARPASAPAPIYTYTQSILPANYYSSGKIQLLELPSDLGARVNNLYIPEFINTYNAAHTEQLSADKIQFTYPKDPIVPSHEGIVIYTSTGFYLSAQLPPNSDAVFQPMSQWVLNNIQSSEADSATIWRQQTQQIITVLQPQLQPHQMSQGQRAALINLQLQLVSLQQQLASFKPAAFYGSMAISPAASSVVAAHPISAITKIILGIILGFIIGVFLAFMVESWQQVKE